MPSWCAASEVPLPTAPPAAMVAASAPCLSASAEPSEMPNTSLSSVAVAETIRSTVSMPAAFSFSTIPSSSPGTDNGAGSVPSPSNWASTSRRFSSSLLMSIFQPVSLAARRTFWPFLPMANES